MMRIFARLSRSAPALVLGLSVFTAGVSAQHTGHERPKDPPVEGGIPLYEDLGDHHYEITVSDPAVQAYFDQGLRLYYAFNHAEAVRSFQEAQRRAPDCAMCWWGEALALGPNINMPMDSASGALAFEAVEEALARQEGASAREGALIRALARRYEPVPSEDRGGLDMAYAEAMKQVHDSFPDDQEAAVLLAESLMDLRPWDYWTEAGAPQPGIERALGLLQTVVERNENHPGACHFYIHAVEKLFPERAVPCAERLAGLMPGAGHIVHMPGHIYIRVGRYLDAINANEHAVHADERYIQDQRPGMTVYTAGYYPHNYDFLAFAAMMIGREEQSVAAADQVAALIPEEMYGAPGMAFLEHWSSRPILMRVRFEQWEEILSTEAPPDSHSHALAIWHYGRGRAYAAKGDLALARTELVRLGAAAARAAAAGLRMEFNESADILAIAEKVLQGWIFAREDRLDEAVAELRLAVAFEDELLYGEPPEWSVPARQDLGAVLLMAGLYQASEQVFEEDLRRFPENHWSLEGLAEARARRTAEGMSP